jgi:hypothetical protein
MAVFSPFTHAHKPGGVAAVKAGEEPKVKAAEPAAGAPKKGDDIADLKAQLANMQAQLEKLSRDRE